MMDAIISGLDRALVGFMSVSNLFAIPINVLNLYFISIILRLWSYNPDNDDQKGDNWNGENFSWFSRRCALPASLLYYGQDSPTLDNGGRILSAIVQPYPAKTAGIPCNFQYKMTTGAFLFEWENPSQGKPTMLGSGSNNNNNNNNRDTKTISNPPCQWQHSLHMK